jgi:hypothetical protein
LFDPQQKWQNSQSLAYMLLGKKIAWHSQGALKVMHVGLFNQNELALDYLMPVDTTVIG